VETNTS